MSYRTFASIAVDAWAYILVVDPNGLRSSNPGPTYFVLDSATLQPGFTDRSGIFSGTLNDNRSSEYGRTIEMGLFSYIAANDEFWVGLQQGPGSPGLPNTWSLGAGGRYWIMGGWISDR